MAPIRRGRTRSSAPSVSTNTPRPLSQTSAQGVDSAQYSCAWYTDSAPSASSRSADNTTGPGWTIPFGGDRTETVVCDNHVISETGSRIDALNDVLRQAKTVSVGANEETLTMVEKLEQMIVQYWDHQTLDGLKDDQAGLTLGNLITNAPDKRTAAAWKEVEDCLGAVSAVISAKGIDSGVKCFSYWDDPVTEE